MSNPARKIIGLFLMLALVVMPVRIAFADNYHPADVAHASPASEASPSPQAHHAVQGSTSAAGAGRAGAANHLAMADMSPDMPSSNTHCDTPDNTACDQNHASNSTHHCSSDAHCCVAFIESLGDAAHAAPYTPRSTLSITLTSIIIPTATKPPRLSFPA